LGYRERGENSLPCSQRCRHRPRIPNQVISG
jgi:hypothetical protein